MREAMLVLRGTRALDERAERARNGRKMHFKLLNCLIFKALRRVRRQIPPYGLFMELVECIGVI